MPKANFQCPACKKKMYRWSDKDRIKSFCETSGRVTVLRRIRGVKK